MARTLPPRSDSAFAAAILREPSPTLGGMLRKMFWLLALLALVWSVTGVVDAASARRRRELWAEATETR